MKSPASPVSISHYEACLRNADIYALEIELRKSIFEDKPWRAKIVLARALKSKNPLYIVGRNLEDAAALGRRDILELIRDMGRENFFCDQLHFAFQRAVISDHYDAAKILKEMGACSFVVHSSLGASSSAMNDAIDKGNRRKVEFLLRRAEPEHRQRILNAALLQAVVVENSELVKFLKEEGAAVKGAVAQTLLARALPSSSPGV